MDIKIILLIFASSLAFVHGKITQTLADQANQYLSQLAPKVIQRMPTNIGKAKNSKMGSPAKKSSPRRNSLIEFNPLSEFSRKIYADERNFRIKNDQFWYYIFIENFINLSFHDLINLRLYQILFVYLFLIFFEQLGKIVEDTIH